MSDLKDDIIGMRPYVQSVPKRDQKIMIMEGPDGTGKTNIGYAISQILKVPYFRMGSQHDNWRKGRFKDALELDQTYLVELLRQTRYDLLIDRAYPSEWVYSRVFERETNMKVLTEIDQAFAKMGAYIIVTLRRDYGKGPADDLIPSRLLPRLHEAYLDFVRWTKCSVVTIYVDDFEGRLDRQLPAIMGEFEFGSPMNCVLKVVLERQVQQERLNLPDDPEEILRTISFKTREGG